MHTDKRVAREGEEELCAKHERRNRHVEDDSRVEGLVLGLGRPCAPAETHAALASTSCRPAWFEV